MFPVLFGSLFVLLASLIPETQGCCRSLRFTSAPNYGYRLKNHVIRNIDVSNVDLCEMECYLESNCVSFNFRNKQQDNGKYRCQLNNATYEHYSDDLVNCTNYIYRGAESACAKTPCKNNATCQAGFTDKDYRCLCSAGFTGDDCENDIDGCTVGTHKCDNKSTLCNSTQGSHNYTCKDGFIVSDIDECASGSHSCDVNAVCNNTQGSYNCTCKDGFHGDGVNCTDIDECVNETHSCDVNTVCNNTKGSYNCTCKDGFVGDGKNCNGRDDCTNGTHSCDVNAVCNNTQGILNCSCIDGFVGDGLVCTDVDECANGTHSCDVNAVCNNTQGSYNCTCKDGFFGDAVNCTDVDECATENHNCSLNESCVNTLGSFTCCSKTTGNSSSPITRDKGYDPQHPACSCADVLINTPESTSGPYYLKTEEGGVAHTYCHMKDIAECGGGGWTLVMKIDGKKTTFTYHSNFWINKTAYNQTSGKTGFDLEETKMPSYWSSPFAKLCLGMRVGQETRWVAVSHRATSLHSLLASNRYQKTNIGRERWKSLLSGSSLQLNCNMEGFNVVSSNGTLDPAIARIGIISDNGNNCESCNSRIGFGSAGSRGGQNNDNSCGNEANNYESDSGVKHIDANCYILVQ